MSNIREKVGKKSPRENRKTPLGDMLYLDWLTLLVKPHLLLLLTIFLSQKKEFFILLYALTRK